jgi:CDP-diacylglycerol--serine O-phosphatidyltransferase
LDGRIARLTKTATSIGAQLDTIADMSSFGIAPIMLVYAWSYGSASETHSVIYVLGCFFSLIYLLCGAFRLARFNIQTPHRLLLTRGTIKTKHINFIGLPISVAAVLVASIVHYAPQPLMKYESSTAMLYIRLMLIIVGVLSVLMISTISYSSFKSIRTYNKSVLIFLIALMTGFVYFFPNQTLPSICAVYILHGLLKYFRKIVSR